MKEFKTSKMVIFEPPAPLFDHIDTNNYLTKQILMFYLISGLDMCIIKIEKMKNLLLLISLTLSQISFAQSNFVVKKGQSRVVTVAESNVFVNEFIMEDNSLLVVPQDVPLWKCTALKASIGKNCTIKAYGHDGSNGDKGVKGRSNGDDCGNGGPGLVGGNGGNGTDACDIIFQMGLKHIGSVTIDMRGGNGGNGAPGGNGGNGGPGDCSKTCNGGTGGPGGQGGRGGNPGDGGHFRLEYWRVSDNEVADTSSAGLYGIRVLVDAGINGRGGLSGKGGKGGPGKDCKWSTNRSPGSDGTVPPHNHHGTPGNKGKVEFVPIPMVTSKG